MFNKRKIKLFYFVFFVWSEFLKICNFESFYLNKIILKKSIECKVEII